MKFIVKIRNSEGRDPEEIKLSLLLGINKVFGGQVDFDVELYGSKEQKNES